MYPRQLGECCFAVMTLSCHGMERLFPDLSHYYVGPILATDITWVARPLLLFLSLRGENIEQWNLFCSWLQLGMQTLDSPLFVSTYHHTKQKGLLRHSYSPSCVSGLFTAGTSAASWQRPKTQNIKEPRQRLGT